ncbi:MAG: PAS domain S-box protein, partial [Spirochaetota bacterium]|nr:PAS domain S-box protein [Spirochaetota bacterium]
LEDPDKKWTIKDISSFPISDQFISSNKSSHNFGHSASAYWVRFTVKNNDNIQMLRFLECKYPPIDHIGFYEPINKHDFLKKKTGDHHPFQTRDVKYRNVVLSLSVNPKEQKTYYLRFESQGAILISLSLWKPKAFYDNKMNNQIALGIFYGIILIMMFYNMFIFLSTKDKSYLYYVLFTISILYYYLAIDGIFTQYLNYNLSYYLNELSPVSTYFIIIFGAQFHRIFLQTNKTQPIMDKIIFTFIPLCAVGLLIYFTAGYRWGSILTGILAILAVTAFMTSAIISLVSGYRAARFYLLAGSFFLIGAFIFPLRNLGFVSENIITSYSLLIGSVIDIVLLSFALGDKINILRQEKEHIQATAYKTLQETYRLKADFAATLEEKIEDRTRELKENEEKYRHLFEASPDGIAIHSEGNLLFINSFGMKLMKINDINDVIGKPIISFVHPGYHQVVAKRLKEASDEPGISLLPKEEKYIRFDGKTIDVEVTTTSYIENKKTIFITIFRDISERKRVEKLRADTERIVRHDIKNPLASILLSTYLLNKDLSDEKQLTRVDQIREGANYIKYLVDNSLDIFKMEEGSYVLRVEEFNLIQLLETKINELTNLLGKLSSDIIILLNGKPTDGKLEYPVQGEGIHLGNLFGNLIKNAIEASPEKSKITININGKHQDYHEITLHNQGLVPESIRDSFFERYSTSGKEKGTGLGTYSARLIARTHGGEIRFTSSENEGTRLVVTLPKK